MNKHFGMLAYSFAVWGVVGMLADHHAAGVVVNTLFTFTCMEALNFLGDKFLAWRRARHA